MDTMESRKEVVAKFAAGTQQLKDALAGMTDRELDFHPAPDAWSIRQIVHHLADDGDVYSFVLKRALATPGVTIRFEGFPGNEVWVDALAFDRRPISDDLALFEDHRREMANLAEYFIDAWDRDVIFRDSEGKELARVNVGGILAMMDGHLQEHLQTIRSLREQAAGL